MHRSKKTSKFRVTGLCAGNHRFPAQRASNAENVSIWWKSSWNNPTEPHALAWGHRPMEPHILAWGPTNLHTKNFQLECQRLKINDKMMNSLWILHSSIHIFLLFFCYGKFCIIPPIVNMGNPDFFVSPSGECRHFPDKEKGKKYHILWQIIFSYAVWYATK